MKVLRAVVVASVFAGGLAWAASPEKAPAAKSAAPHKVLARYVVEGVPNAKYIDLIESPFEVRMAYVDGWGYFVVEQIGISPTAYHGYNATGAELLLEMAETDRVKGHVIYTDRRTAHDEFKFTGKLDPKMTPIGKP